MRFKIRAFQIQVGITVNAQHQIGAFRMTVRHCALQAHGIQTHTIPILCCSGPHNMFSETHEIAALRGFSRSVQHPKSALLVTVMHGNARRITSTCESNKEHSKFLLQLFLQQFH